MDEVEYITSRETAIMLGHKTTKPVAKLLKNNQIAGHREAKRFGRRSRWKIEKKSVIAYIENHRYNRRHEITGKYTVTVAQAAEKLGYTEIYIAKLCRNGNLDAVKTSSHANGCWRISSASIANRLLEGHPVAEGADRQGRRKCQNCETMTHYSDDGIYLCAKHRGSRI